jgi:hypothetical protein
MIRKFLAAIPGQGGDTPDLAGDTDLEPVWIVVSAIAMSPWMPRTATPASFFEIGDDETECMTVIKDCRAMPWHAARTALLGRGDRRNDRDLAAELAGSPCVAAVDALHLGACND